MDLPLGEMLEHQNQIEANVPKFSGTVLAEFQERIHLILNLKEEEFNEA